MIQTTDESKFWQELYAHPQILKVYQKLVDEYGADQELKIQQQMRKDYPVELIRIAIELSQVRQVAARKFSRANEMWMHRKSYEQASSEIVSQYKSKRFPAGYVHDLCCGLGADAIAMAAEHDVVAYDSDAVTLQFCQWNAKTYDVADQIETRQVDVREVGLSEGYFHLDPDQRDAQGRRHRRLEQVTPDLEFLQLLAHRMTGGAIKLSPASNFGGKFPDCETELISLCGECKEATIWCGELGTPGIWRATALPSGETIAGDPMSVWCEPVEVGEYLYDPDPAVVRAGLVNLLADQSGVQRLDLAEEYLTSTECQHSEFLTPFQVQEILPNKIKEIKKYFRSHPVGELEIKCRHLPISAETIRQQIPRTGAIKKTLVFARVLGKACAIICERVTA